MLIRLGSVFFLLSVIFWLWAIFDSITADDSRIRWLPKWAWVILVLLLLEVGALAWVLFGRPRAGAGSSGSGPGGSRLSGSGFGGSGLGGSRFGSGSGGLGRSGPGSSGSAGGSGRGPLGAGRPGPAGQRRPVGPDDDPDFLRGLSNPD
jgi:hypothetical protein